MPARGALAVMAMLSATAGGAELNGSLGLEQRVFPERGAASSRRGVSSVVLEPELVVSSATHRVALLAQPFYRWDSEDANRSHFDLRELAIEMQRGEFDLRLGARRVFWGVAESQHVVDVVNQTDVLESLDLEEKLGQPMLNVNWRPGFAGFELYVLPLFREREFKGEQTRLGPALAITGAEYEDSDERHHLDFAARVQFAPRQQFDVALSHFYGTNREPLLLPRNATDPSLLTAYYSIVRQTGLELQWTHGSLALKSESFYRAQRGHDTFRAVYGLEHTFFQLGGSRRDLGVILEHNYDSRLNRALTPFQNDLFVGARLSFNDEGSSELVAGVFRDLSHASLVGKIEWRHRCADSVTATLNVYAFHQLQQREPLYGLRKDGFIELGVSHHL